MQPSPQKLLSHRPHSQGQSRSGAPGPVAAWWKKKGRKNQVGPAMSLGSSRVDNVALAHALGPAQARLLKLIVKGWCYFPHFRGAKYCRKQFCRFSLPTGRCVHSNSISSYKQLQDLLDELLFRLRSSIRNCPQYKSVPVWVPPEPQREPELVAPDLIPLPQQPALQVGQKPEFVPPPTREVGPAPAITAFNELQPERARVEEPQVDGAGLEGGGGDGGGGVDGARRGEEAGTGTLLPVPGGSDRRPPTLSQHATLPPPPVEEPLPPFMPPRLIFKHKPTYRVPASTPFPQLIDGNQYLVSENTRQQLAGFSPVFVLDVSGTMAGAPVEDLRAAMLLLLHERGAIARAMRKGCGFNILAYAWDAEWWVGRPAAYSAENVEVASRWVGQWPGKGVSNAHAALKMCYERGPAMPAPSAVFLLSDGLLDDKMKVLDLVRRNTALAALPVHVVACGDHAANAAFLSRVAEESQGTYTVFHRNANGAKALHELQETVVGSHVGGALDSVSMLRELCASAQNVTIQAQIDAANAEQVRAWEADNAQRRRRAFSEYQALLAKEQQRFDEACEAALRTAETEYRDLCRDIARRNHDRRLRWKRQHERARAQQEASVHSTLAKQDQDRRAVAQHRRWVEEQRQARELHAQLDLEMRTKAWKQRRARWDAEQQQRREEYMERRKKVLQDNATDLENARRDWDAAYESECEAAYVAHEISLAEWKDKADVIQAKNDKILREKKQEHAAAVREVRGQNERDLQIAREEYDDEIGAVQYYNASIEPVVKKADRAQMLISNCEKFTEMIFNKTQDFASTVEIPVLVDAMQAVFPDASSKMLAEAFEEHFTAEELRTRSFYPFYHHHFLKSKAAW
eukprot:g4539.t1